MSEIGPISPPPPPVLPKSNPINKRLTKKKNLAEFWKATTFLLPYRRLMIISILSALFIGLAMAGGLGSLLPVLRVLISGDTIPNWVNRGIAESRLKITLASESTASTDLLITSTKPDGSAAAAGLARGDMLAPPGSDVDAAKTLSDLSDPAINQIVVHPSIGKSITIANLPAVPWWFVHLRPLVQRFPTKPVPAIICVLLLCLCINVFGNVISYFQNYYSDAAAILAIRDIRRRLYDHVLHAPMGFFGASGTSDVTSRILGDCLGLQDGFTTILGNSIQMPINAIMAAGVALWISWKLTLFIVLVAPVMIGVIRKFGKKMRRASRGAMQSSSVLMGQLGATLNGIRVVKGANAERFERRRFKQILGDLSRKQLHMSRLDAISSPVMEVSTTLVVCIVIVWATYLVRVTQELTTEKFFVVMTCLAVIGEAARRMGKLNSALQKSGAAATRIFEVLERDVERPRQMIGRENRPRIQLPTIQKEIRFSNVSFAYANTIQPALTDVDMTVRKGETVAVVGRNGSGKTTLLALLPRLFDPSEGTITIDGINIQDVTLKSLRDQVSVVTQDSVIFPATIAENIAYGHPLSGRLKEKTPAVIELRKRIEAAARQAFAHDFIMEKPEGYETELVGLGGALSGGQKQRLNIARAILRSTPILILDEATSQVDAESEHLIQQAVEALMHDRTVFVIAHRLNTIKSADRIIVMDRGRVDAIGQHEELLKTSEAYRNLYERQLFIKPDDPPAAA
jgi:subfamily B ATP-binding cassette protein MsbA